MELNADFSQRAVVHAARLGWTPSPIAGVERRMLDRIGEEVARATSIVRYAPHSRFSSHTHGGGEEFLVLDGVFQDEHGDFPAGSYIRNPPTSSHTPGSVPGCTIFVKLWQFDPERPHACAHRHGRAAATFRLPDRAGGRVDAAVPGRTRDVRLESWAPGAEIVLPAPGGLELLVLDGRFERGRRAIRAAIVAPTSGRRDVAGQNWCQRLPGLGEDGAPRARSWPADGCVGSGSIPLLRYRSSLWALGQHTPDHA